MRALVIGADGFAGRWLLRHLVESGDEVTAVVGPGYAGSPLPERLHPHPVDVRDADAVAGVVRRTRPQAIYYLAGISRAGDRDDLRQALGVSVHGAVNVLASASEVRDGPLRLLHVGSSHMYGPPMDARPISETAPLRPTTVYGAAKAAAEAALLTLGPTTHVDVIGVRAFNHIGPGQAPDFVVPSLAMQVAAIADGKQEPVIRAGDLGIERDFTDVRDVVRAYRLLALKGDPGDVYNVASGRAIRIGGILDRLLTIAEIDAERQSDPGLTRSGPDPAVLVGDPAKLSDLTGWRPEVPTDTTLCDVLDAVRRGWAGTGSPGGQQ